MSADYYEAEIGRVLPSFGISVVKIVSDSGETKTLDLNKDSIPVLINYLLKELIK